MQNFTGSDPISTFVPEAHTAGTVLLGTETTGVVNENGTVLLSLHYSENGDEAVRAAIDLLGEPEATHHQDGSNHYP